MKKYMVSWLEIEYEHAGTWVRYWLF